MGYRCSQGIQLSQRPRDAILRTYNGSIEAPIHSQTALRISLLFSRNWVVIYVGCRVWAEVNTDGWNKELGESCVLRCERSLLAPRHRPRRSKQNDVGEEAYNSRWMRREFAKSYDDTDP